MKKITLLIASSFLAACSESQLQPLTVEVAPQKVTTRIFATGELEATESTPIKVPMMRRGKIISWLAPNNSKVVKGQVVIKFDDYEFIQEKQKQEFEIAKLEIEDEIASGKTEVEVKSIEKGLKEVSHERQMNEKVEWDNDQVFSKLEIIDSMQNLEYLNAKEGFFNWKYDQNEVKNSTSQQIRDLAKQRFQSKLQQAQESLTTLAITAPHDGIFVYKKNWSGDDPFPGQQVWPGHAIGELPDLNKMQAKMWVREQEASGLQEGLKVEIRIDAFADDIIQGTITKASKFAKQIDKDSPVKFIEITVGFEDLDTSNLRPGLKLSGHILTHDIEHGIVLPAQAVYQEQDKTIVYRKNGDGFDKIEVETGYRNQTLVEVVKGLEPGDQVALNKPGV